MKTIIIAGGSGFLGQSLGEYLHNKGYQVHILSRTQPKKVFDGWIQWDARTLADWVARLEGAEALVNLVGRSVDCVKTPENVDLIWRSRIESTQILGQAMDTLQTKPKVWIQMSTAHIYGDPPEVLCDEDSPIGHGLAPDVGEAWERAHREFLPDGMRSVILRTGFVIGKGGGALARMKQVVRLGMGGTIGKGTQGMSWIHQSDVNKLIVEMIENPTYSGVYNVTSPNPIDKKRFMKMLRTKMKFPFAIPAPEFLVRFGARNVFKTDPELALYGRYVISKRLEKAGFEFDYPQLEMALDDLV